MPQGPVASRRCTSAWPKDVLRITFGVIWLIDATLKWLPGFRLLALSYYAGPARYSVDYHIEQKVSWWWRVAETRRPAPVGAPAAAGTTPAADAVAGPQPQNALPRSA